MQGVNIEDVKKYNASLKQYQDQSAKIRAGIEYNTKELERLCKELSAELGTTVTAENIRQVYQEHMAKIENILSVGNDILGRIQSEEANAAAAPVANETQSVAGAPAFQMPSAPAAPSAPTAPGGPDFFNNLGSIPNMFGQKI